MKKWKAPKYSDQAKFEHGIYVLAEKPDEFGPRAFMTLNLVWEEAEVTFLTDAATNWGMAPWALANAQESMRIKPLGTWGQFVGSHGKSLSLISAACREKGEDSHAYGGLLLVRTCLRLEGMSKGKDVGVDVARHCLKQELERDAMIREAKAKKYALANPDWKPPAAAAP